MKSFVSKVKSRLNLGIALRSLCIGLIIAASVTVLLGCYYVFRGYAVNPLIYAVGGAIVLISSLILWVTRKKNEQTAAVFADEFFELKDSVVSTMEFQEAYEENKYFELQYAQTEKRIQGLDPKSIPFPFTKKLAGIAGVITIVAASMSLIPPSEEVIEQLRKEEEMQKRTTEIQKQFEQNVEEMLSDLTEEEKALISEDEIRKWVKEMKPTAKEREAMLNIARIKQNIQKKIAGLENRKNEALLKKAGIKLQKASSSKARSAGEAMSQKDFEAVKKALEEFKLKKDKEAKLKEELDKLLEKLKNDAKDLTEEKKKELLEKLRQKMEEMRELTKRLSEAALDEPRNEDGEFGDMPDDFNFNDLPADFPMDRLMELLDKHARGMQDKLDEEMMEMMEGDPMTEEELLELLEMLENMDEGMEQLQDEMDEMEARRRLRERMKNLKKGMGQAQGFARGKSFRLNMPG